MATKKKAKEPEAPPSVTVVDGQAVLTSEGTQRPLTAEELNALRREVDAAFVEVN